MQETVLFVNHGFLPVRVSWVPEVASVAVDRPASVWVTPESFVVEDRVMVHVRVEPKRGGRIRETLRFRSTNGDGDVGNAAVYVRGAVERTPEVHVRPTAVVALGPSCAGTPELYGVDFRLANAVGPFDVIRQQYELDDTGALNVRGTAKTYGPYGTAGSAVRATLNFQTPFITEVGKKWGKSILPLAGDR